MKVEGHLAKRRLEPLQIPYPADFPRSKKSNDPDDQTLCVGMQPRWFTEEEAELVEQFCKGLQYTQSLQLTGAKLIDSGDHLLQATQDELDQVERNASLPNTRRVRGGTERTVRERVLIIRERGYRGNGAKAIQQGE